jgi:thiamine biosynthesis lipoprotein
MNRVLTASRTKSVFTLLVFLLAGQSALWIQSNDGRVFEVSATQYLLGTRVDLLAQHESVRTCKLAFSHAFREIDRIENLLNAQSPASEIGRINQNAGRAPVKVSYETLAIIKRALEYSKKFDGYFDISLGPIAELWGFSGNQQIIVPEHDRIVALLPLVDYQKITIAEKDTIVALAREGMKLDLGSIAKGYAIDRAAAVLKQMGVKNFLINAGGDIYVAGRKNNEQKWLVGIQHPRHRRALMASFELSDLAVATSGDYERFVEAAGKRYHHMLDPRTGYPAPRCQSVTVLAPTAEEAEVWATYLFIIGFEAYRRLAAPGSPTALFVDAGGKIHWDIAWEQDYHLRFLD